MSNFEPDEESVMRAEKLSGRMMHDVRNFAESREQEPEFRERLFVEQRYAEQAEGVPINDVAVNIGQMASEFAMARRWDGEVPCVKLEDGEMVPISIASLFGGVGQSQFGMGSWIEWMEFMERYGPFPFPPRRMWREFSRRAERAGERVMMTGVSEAEESVGRALKGFLSYRFAGMKKWSEWIQGVVPRSFGGSKGPPGGKQTGSGGAPPPPSVGPGGGLQVQVSCLTPGLRIHFSPAYFINWVFFGSPTTPVTSYVLPGRYIFAGDGPMLPNFTQDAGVFCIPPTYHASLARF